ncbi:hypothetical protein BS78_08G159900 [Paspalum vaginatum]|nr:hypothetical protein BS78_08G159900 [Paspalum vaginatum]
MSPRRRMSCCLIFMMMVVVAGFFILPAAATTGRGGHNRPTGSGAPTPHNAYINYYRGGGFKVRFK